MYGDLYTIKTGTKEAEYRGPLAAAIEYTQERGKQATIFIQGMKVVTVKRGGDLVWAIG